MNSVFFCQELEIDDGTKKEEEEEKKIGMIIKERGPIRHTHTQFFSSKKEKKQRISITRKESVRI